MALTPLGREADATWQPRKGVTLGPLHMEWLEANPGGLRYTQHLRHQDPELRRLCSEELLPELASRGGTILAISHDDRYLGTGDRALRSIGGQLWEA